MAMDSDFCILQRRGNSRIGLEDFLGASVYTRAIPRQRVARFQLKTTPRLVPAIHARDRRTKLEIKKEN